MCDVPLWRADAIIQAAVDLPVHNQYPGYNSQEYVLELLEDLEEKGLINDLYPAEGKCYAQAGGIGISQMTGMSSPRPGDLLERCLRFLSSACRVV